MGGYRAPSTRGTEVLKGQQRARLSQEQYGLCPGEWRATRLGVGLGEGLGDSGVEGGAAPGGVWEALAVAAQGRDTPEPPPCSPTGQSCLAAQGQSEEGEFAVD